MMLNPVRKNDKSGVATEKSAAILTIRDADKMTKAGRKRIAKWLQRQAEFLQEHGHEYAPTFRGRYLYSDNGTV